MVFDCRASDSPHQQARQLAQPSRTIRCHFHRCYSPSHMADLGLDRRLHDLSCWSHQPDMHVPRRLADVFRRAQDTHDQLWETPDAFIGDRLSYSLNRNRRAGMLGIRNAHRRTERPRRPQKPTRQQPPKSPDESSCVNPERHVLLRPRTPCSVVRPEPLHHVYIPAH